MDKIKLRIIGMSYSQSQSGAYALILGETDGERRLPIIIGGFEAQAIAIELEKMKPSRPLTHDLFKNFAQTFNILLKEVIINKFHEGVFYARLVCSDGSRIVEIDSRTSDAVALAIRFNCPVYTYEKIMSVAGIVMEDEPETDIGSATPAEVEIGENEFEDYTISELQEMITKAIDVEDYERASLLQREINKRTGKGK